MTSPAQNVVTITGAASEGFEAAIGAALSNLTNLDLGYQTYRFKSYEVVQLKGRVSDRGLSLRSRTIEPGGSYEVVLNVTYEDYG